MTASPLKILVVDDDDLVRSVLESIFAEMDYSVITACDGQTGLEAFRRHKPDLVFTDLKMPNMDGFAFIPALKALNPEVPIIVFSGAGTLNDAIEAIHLGAWDYITKPVTIPALEIALQQVKEKMRLLAENRSYQHYLEDLIMDRTLKLRDTDIRFRTLFESANDAIILMLNDCIISCNNKALQMFQCAEENILGNTLLNFSPPTQSGGCASETLFKEHIDRAMAGDPQFYEWRHTRHDGSAFEVEISLNRIKLQEAYHLQAIMRDITERKKAEVALLDNIRLKRELEIAREIQRSLLPANPPVFPDLLIACHCIPAGSVGGDYYDFFIPDENTLDIVIADVAGHSIGSALLMVQTRSTLHAKASGDLSPRSLLSAVNDLLFADLCRAELQISAFYARLDRSSRLLTYANAGHSRPLLFSSRTRCFEEMDSDGLIMGINCGVAFEEDARVLEDDDIVVFFTDGVTDTESPAGEFFGAERLKDAIMECRHDHPERMLATLLHKLAEFSGGQARTDDISIIILKVVGKPPAMTSGCPFTSAGGTA